MRFKQLWSVDYIILSDIWELNPKKTTNVFSSYEDFVCTVKAFIESNKLIYNTDLYIFSDEIPNTVIRRRLEEMYPDETVIVTDARIVFSFSAEEDTKQ